MDDQGGRWAELEEPLTYRPPEWDSDSRAVSWHQLLLPGEAPLTAYSLSVRLAGGVSGEPLGDAAVLATSTPAEIAQAEPLVTFGPDLQLLDATVRLEDVASDEELVAELILETTAPLPLSYTLFLHVLDSSGQRVGQRDTAAGGGLFPTDAWQPGQAIRDTYRVPVDLVEVQHPLSLALGFYDWQTGDRLPAFDRNGERLPEDRLILDLPVD